MFGPAPIRSGRKAYPTRSGWHTIYWRLTNHWSTRYHPPMPYSQFFSGGQAFHAVYGSLHGDRVHGVCESAGGGRARVVGGREEEGIGSSSRGKWLGT